MMAVEKGLNTSAFAISTDRFVLVQHSDIDCLKRVHQAARLLRKSPK